MQVGELNATGDSFDIKHLAETNAVLIRNDGQTKFIYKDELNQAVMLRRIVDLGVGDTMLAGTSLKLSESAPGYATHNVERVAHVEIGRTMASVDWDAGAPGFKTKSVQVDGVQRFAALVPVLLRI
jgi:hypothetical protein